MKKTKRLLVSLLATVMVFSAVSMPTFASDAQSVDTDPAAISSVEEFLALDDEENLGGSFYLDRDIDFSGTPVTTPYLLTKFHGVLDGRGHTISGFALNYTAGTEDTGNLYVGICKELGGSSLTVITNLNIGTEEHPIQAELDDSLRGDNSQLNFGILAGKANGVYGVTIRNVHIYAEIDATLTQSNHTAVAGFVGDAYQMDMIDCSFTGKIDVTNTQTEKSKYVGGLVALLRQGEEYTGTFRSCVNNANLVLTGGATVTAGECGVGGIVGMCKRNCNFVDCENNGTVTSEKNGGGIVGEIRAYQGTILAVIADCSNTGTVTASTQSGDMFGSTHVYSGYSIRLCVVNCKNNHAASTQNTPIYDVDITYTSAYEYIVPIKTAEDFALIGSSEVYPITGFYYLDGANGTIDFANKGVISDFVVSQFSGVLYGNNNTLKNIRFSGKGDLGFFHWLADSDDAAVLKFKLGTAEHPISMTETGANKTVGALASRIGYTGENVLNSFDTLVLGVELYVDYTQTALGGNIGMIGGMAGRYSCFDCEVHGDMCLTESADEKNTNLAAFVGTTKFYKVNDTTTSNDNRKFKTSFVDCDNFANISMSVSEITKDHRAAGFFGYTESVNGLVLGCNNFGTITHRETGVNSYVSAFVADVNRASIGNMAVTDCINFGTLYGGQNCGVAIARMNKSLATSVVSVEDYGSVHAGVENANRYVCSGAASIVGCFAETALSMRYGASVKIASKTEDTGLRFMSDASEAAMKALEELFGTNAISYGTLIAPTAFITGAGDFTASALDDFAKKRSEHFKNGAKAYVDVPATGWFTDGSGENKGVIAASVVNIGDLYNVELAGRSYIKVAVDQQTTVVLYAEYFEEDIKNNTRTVKAVVESVLSDVLYRTGTDDTNYEYYTLNPDGTTYTKYTGDDKNRYTTVLGEANGAGYTQCGCYTSAQYEQLNLLMENMK